MTDIRTITDKPVIVIGETPDVVPGQKEGEVPVITIERSDDAPEEPSKPRRMWLTVLIAAIAAAAVFVLLLGAWKTYKYYFSFGVPIGTSPSENIAKLERGTKCAKTTADIGLTSDSILGVAMNFYDVSGLEADIMLSCPDTTDASVQLCTRSADYTPTGDFLGSLVIGGKVLQTDRSRVGYCGMANGRVVIGVSRSEKVKDYCAERGGSFFRQFVLVSDGTLPSRFVLHGKVERRALGRMADDRIFLIETRHKETLWDFADALREYGFVDAIYITGGAGHSWYRSAEGLVHDIGLADSLTTGKARAGVPWLVFKKKR